jgi:hypothetical protein
LGSDGVGPEGDAIERGGGIQDVVDKGGQCFPVSQYPLAPKADGRIDDFQEIEALEEVGENGVRAQEVGVEVCGVLTSMHK